MRHLNLVKIHNADEQIHNETLGGGLPVIPFSLRTTPAMVQRAVLWARLAQRIAPMMVQRVVLRLRLAQRIGPRAI